MIRRVDAATVRPLREAVLRPGLAPEKSVYPQDDVASTVHLAAYDDAGTLLGCATVFPEADDDERAAWRLRGMATTPEVRGTGIGAALLAAAVEVVRGAGAPLLWCNARVPAAGFYARYDFVTSGDIFDVPDAGPHYLMRLRLAPDQS